MNLLGGARRRAGAILALVVVLGAAGAWEAARLPSSIFPSVTFPIVKVIADAGEEPAARMMPTVTRPLEEAIHRVPGVRLVRSTTSRGSSEISAQFAWGTDMRTALQRTQAETQRIRPDLPQGIRIDVEWMNTAIFPILGYALTSDTRSQAYLRQLAEYTLKPALIRIPGISQVQIQGGRQREFQVRLDPSALQARNLAPSDVVSAIQENDDVLSAGLTEANHELYLTLVDGRVHALDSLSRISVPVAGGPSASLSDLGSVDVADEVSYIRTTAGGHQAVLVNIVRQPSANTVAIADGIRKLLRQRPDLIPKGVRWTTFYDQARFVSNSVGGTRDAIIIGVILAALVLLVFLRSFRLTAIAVAALPATVALVGLALGATGRSVNLMTLSGVAAALGLIADDAIVVIENIERHHRPGEEGDPAEQGTRQILPALVGSSLSTTVILLPFALLTGVVGAFFKPLALTMALALTVSFFIAALVVPVLAGRYGFRGRHATGRQEGSTDGGPWSALPGGLGEGGRRLAVTAGKAYDRTARFFVDHGAASVAVLLVLMAVAFQMYRRIGTDFLPAMDEGSIILDYSTPPGTSLTETNRMLDDVEKVILSVPDVSSYSRRTGTQLGFFITEPNRGDYVINLKPRGRRRPIENVIAELRRRVARVEPAVRTDFGQLLEDNIGDLTGGTPQPIDLKIFGDDQQLLQRKARQIASVISGVRGVEDVFDGIVIAGPALRIRVDPAAAARYGLTTRKVHSEVAPAVTGSVVDRIRIGDRMYDLRVLSEGGRPLQEMRIRTASGGLVPLSAVATVSTGQPESEIDRENLATYVGVTARVSGRDLGSTMAEIRSSIQRQVTLPPGFSIQYGGLYQQQQQSFRNLLYILLAGLVLVSVVVLFEFGDWRAPVVTSVCAASVLAGVLLALRLTGVTLNISSYVGAIMMVGIVGENAIFVIHEAREELRREVPVPLAWARSSRRRLRPVAMTILATGFALAPLAIAYGQGSQLMQPLAIAVIGGFVLSGPIVLLLLPGLYRLLDPHGKLAGE
ncbi:MAG TPA: efflux RND transporter permease subunit [Gemmatimonadota bacterium]|nr:efflux RND transporter permease subunit [Gemmatimonadota bacterium]